MKKVIDNWIFQALKWLLISLPFIILLIFLTDSGK